jgi:hypothetical protein
MTLLISVGMVLSFSNCSRNADKELIEVFIDNRLDESIFIENIRLTATRCQENEKQYFLSTPIFFDQDSIRMNGPFSITGEISAKTTKSIKIRKFAITNEKYEYEIGEKGKTINNVKENFYDNSNITFPLFYLLESHIISDYDEYEKTIKENGFIVKGYMSKTSIVFRVYEKIHVIPTG